MTDLFSKLACAVLAPEAGLDVRTRDPGVAQPSSLGKPGCLTGQLAKIVVPGQKSVPRYRDGASVPVDIGRRRL